MQGSMIPRWGLIGLLVVAMISSAACATRTRYLTIRVPEVPPPTEGQPLPLSAGLVLPDAVRTASHQDQINCPFSTTIFVLQLGPGFEKGAVQAFSQAFSKLEAVRSRAAAAQYDLIIEPSAPELTLDGHCGLFSRERPMLEAKAVIHVKVTDRKNQVLLDNTYSSDNHKEERITDAVGKAMTDVLQTTTQGILSAPKVLLAAGLPAVQAEEQNTVERKVDERKPVQEPAQPVEVAKSTDPVSVGFSVGYGYIVTAYHAIAGSSNLVISHRDRAFPAILVMRDRLNDIALLKFKGAEENPLLGGVRLGDASKVRAGDRIWMWDRSVSSGGDDKSELKEGKIRSVSADGGDPRLLHITVSVQPRYSGSPVLNDQGEVVGLTVAHSDAPHVFPAVGILPLDHAIAVKIQYARWLLSLLPESEYVAPTSRGRSVPLSAFGENITPQVVMIHAKR